MARPIPVNEAGLRDGQRLDAQVYTPVWNIPRQAPPPARVVLQQRPPAVRPGARQQSWQPTGLLFLGASTLLGVFAIVSSLGLWPNVAATRVGLDDRDCFLLLAGGVYLLATAIYAISRTRFLVDLCDAPFDARLMAYANLGVGGAVTAAFALAGLAIALVIVILAGIVALVLSGTGGQVQG